MNAQAADSRPNIIFINTDEQSAQMMSCAGNPWLHTPAMDRLAAEGIRFERAYCTHPVCLPSRFSWFTGRMPSELNIWDNKSGSNLDRVPWDMLNNCAGHLLRRAGYRTAYGGKTHLPGDMTPESMGFENITADKRDGLAETCADWIAQRGKANDGPFFLTACFVNPHDICFMGMRDFIRETRADSPDLNFNERWLLSDDSVEMAELNQAMRMPDGVSEDAFYDKHCPPLPDNHQPQDPEPTGLTRKIEAAPYRRYIREQWDERRWRLHRWAYARLVERVDEQVGRVIQALDDAKLTENTLVIFTSDHGDHDGSHKLEQKGTVYEEAARVPLLMRWPGQIEGGQVNRDALVSNGLDLVPTLCDLAGCAVPSDLRGQSVRPLLDRRASPTSFREALPLESAEGCAIVDRRFKYIRYHEGDDAEQLMDLQEDPGETRNHIDRAGLADELTQCRRLYERLHQARADTKAWTPERQ